MIIVTGAAGFIGSSIIQGLNRESFSPVLAVGDLTDGTKCRNLVDLHITDFMDKEDFLARLLANETLGPIEAIIHQGACATTTEWDGRFMMRNNYEYSKVLLDYAIKRGIPFIYASSAAVYGLGMGEKKETPFREDPQHESPLNVYGYAKFLFDQYVRNVMHDAEIPIVGLRYFNVYGPRESHKGSMASVAFHLHQQLSDPNNNTVTLFEGCDGYGDGEQRRDFVYIDDVVNVNLWMLNRSNVHGIFNVGTGRSQTFNEVAQSVVDFHGRGSIEYIPFPAHLRGAYQSFTQADISALRAVGYEAPFSTVQEGVTRYLTAVG